MIRYLISALFACGSIAAQQKQDIYFDFDIDVANNTSEQAMNKWIADNKDNEITKIYGYADTTGNAMYNIDLSERRAHFVEGRFKNNNIKLSDKIEVKGFGESTDAPSPEGNRRVTIYFNKLEKVIKPLAAAVQKAKKGDKLKLPGLNFYDNSDRLLPQSRPVVEELLAILQNEPKLKIEIQGHICCQPTEVDKISHYRARAIYQFLINNGIDKSRLTFTSFGSSRPIYPLPEKDESQRMANRRVEIEIIEN